MAEPLALENDVVNYDELQTRALTSADLEIRSGGDGRSVYGVIVPFGREAVIQTRSGSFREMFRSGAFRQSINNGVSRVKLFQNHNHLRGMDPIGVATSLVEDRDKLVGEFRVANTAEGENALQMVRDGVFDAFSIGFLPLPGKQLRSKDLVEHTEVKLREVSLVSYPAYEGAAIAGLRSAFPELTPQILERLLALAELNLDTLRSEAVLDTSETEQSTRNDEQVLHSSTENDTDKVPSPIDTSFEARQWRARQIEARRRGLGKRA